MSSTIAIKDRSMEKFSTGFQSLREVRSLMTKILNCASPWSSKILGICLPCGKVYNRNTWSTSKIISCCPLWVSTERESAMAESEGKVPSKEVWGRCQGPGSALTHSLHFVMALLAREHGYYCLGSYHLTARFCTSPFLSSSNFKSIFTTFFSLSSSSFIESFCSSIIRSLVAINLKAHREKVDWLMCRHKCITFASPGTELGNWCLYENTLPKSNLQHCLRKRKITTILQVDNYLTGVR